MLKQQNADHRSERGWMVLPYVIAMVITGNVAVLTGMIGTNSWPTSAGIGFTAALLAGGALFTFEEMRRACR